MMPTNTSSTARVNGVELGYQLVGEGKPLILLHGGFGSVEMFGPNVELLAAGRRVIGVDLQSHGRSPAADRADALRENGRGHRGAGRQPRARASRDHGLLTRPGR